MKKKLVVCGSMCYFDKMVEAKDRLDNLGFDTHIPVYEHEDKADSTIKERMKLKSRNDIIRYYSSFILCADGIVVVNHEQNEVAGYVGDNTLIEMGFAYIHGRDIFLMQDVPEMVGDWVLGDLKGVNGPWNTSGY